MVRDHVHADLDGHDHAPEFDGCIFGKFRVAAILQDGQACGSGTPSTHGASASARGAGPGSTERGDAWSIGASSNDAVEIAQTAGAS
jgi:hypothetical protein